MCRKQDFLKIDLEEELWLDELKYALGDDQAMFYKMHLYGLKQLTLFGSGIRHLDAGSTLQNVDKERQMVEADYYFRLIFWSRFIQEPEKNPLIRVWNRGCISYFYLFGLMMSLLKRDHDMLGRKLKSIKRARSFLKSELYASIPKIVKK